jgi:regulator of CtrA degradation
MDETAGNGDGDGTGGIAPETALMADFTERTYRDAMSLVFETVNYLEGRGTLDRDELTPIGRARLAAEAMRHTTRLMQVVSWFLVQKAVAAGEMSRNEAQAPSRRLGAIEVCLGQSPGAEEILPPRMASLMIRSRALFEQALRLEAQMLKDPSETPNPVRDLIDRLR